MKLYTHIFCLLLMAAMIRAEDKDSGALPDPVEQMTESVVRDPGGNIIRSVISKTTSVAMTRKVDETRVKGKDGNMVLSERKTSTLDVTGSRHSVVESLNASGELVVKHMRSLIVDPEGGTLTVEKNLNKNGVLGVTRRVSVTGTRTDRVTVAHRFNEDGNLTVVVEGRTTVRDGEGGKTITTTRSRQQQRGKDGVLSIVSDNETVTEKELDGTTVTIYGARSKEGIIFPNRRVTTTREASGSYLEVTEARGGDGQWKVTGERTFLSSHVSSLKIPSVEATLKSNWGPQK